MNINLEYENDRQHVQLSMRTIDDISSKKLLKVAWEVKCPCLDEYIKKYAFILSTSCMSGDFGYKGILLHHFVDETLLYLEENNVLPKRKYAMWSLPKSGDDSIWITEYANTNKNRRLLDVMKNGWNVPIHILENRAYEIVK